MVVGILTMVQDVTLLVPEGEVGREYRQGLWFREFGEFRGFRGFRGFGGFRVWGV